MQPLQYRRHEVVEEIGNRFVRSLRDDDEFAARRGDGVKFPYFGHRADPVIAARDKKRRDRVAHKGVGG